MTVGAVRWPRVECRARPAFGDASGKGGGSVTVAAFPRKVLAWL